ncbi:hypothetical protein FA95DRAFT_1600566 [Auriscalpium vulgare]|uniref:Uncharacterized protein n=1 Tax=Auriscalpium vulgare TaxID=40419 RepID=A0ACB8SD37_9AGAM|nr:hypothetical protein FA95DRAFT_1600566 [Auriscalpium vulgare]
MSLTIRIPKKVEASSSAGESPSTPRPALKRKASKRRVASDSDYEEDQVDSSSQRPAPKRKASKSAPRGKGRAGKEDEDSPIPVKDERRLSAAKVKEATPVTGSRRTRESSLVEDVEVVDMDVDIELVADTEETFRATSGPPPTNVADLLKDDPPNPSPLPSFKKRTGKLPPIKKLKADPGNAAAGSSSQAAAKPKTKPSDGKGAIALDDGAKDDGLSHLIKQAKPVQKVEVDLMNKDVYASLFQKAPGVSAPRSGVNLKEKEERRKELDRMREEDRARRAAAAQHVFDLRSQHDKIVGFGDRMRLRKSIALWPNILAVAFRHEKQKEDMRRERDMQVNSGDQEMESGEVVDDSAL